MAFKMKGSPYKMKSPVKHYNTKSTGHGAERGITEENYKSNHPGPGTPDTRGYHTGHKGDSPTYTTAKKGASKVKKGTGKKGATGIAKKIFKK